MNFKVIVHPSAVADIEAARAYLLEWSEKNADRWYGTMKSEIISLQQMPRRFPVAPESVHVGREVRHMIVGKFRVLFTVNDSEVHVLHIRHAALPPLSAQEGF